MASPTVENYVKAVYGLSTNDGGRRATTGRLAVLMKVSPGTVTSMLKTLSQSGLATYTPYEGVRLTDAGTVLALRVLRRHRLLELFLVKALGLGWDQVHDDAEQMEHAVSDFLIERIDEYLGHPQFDPHGDPIPSRDGKIAHREGQRLNTCRAGARFQLVRVLDQSPRFLRYLRDSGLAPGAVGEVLTTRREAGVIMIRIDDREITLSADAAYSLLISTQGIESA